jgi:hypothetical protein
MPKRAIDGLVDHPPECMVVARYRGSGEWDVVKKLCSDYYRCFGNVVPAGKYKNGQLARSLKERMSTVNYTGVAQ